MVRSRAGCPDEGGEDPAAYRVSAAVLLELLLSDTQLFCRAIGIRGAVSVLRSSVGMIRTENHEASEKCQICRKDVASVYVVISRDWFACKGHLCFTCFSELEECGRPWVESVSLQEFQQARETSVVDWEKEWRTKGLPGKPKKSGGPD
jgi:hypothetical protein